jgi:hypothetical protein
LEGRSRAQRGVESQIVGFSLGGTGLDVTAALAVGMGARAPAPVVARQFIQGSV